MPRKATKRRIAAQPRSSKPLPAMFSDEWVALRNAAIAKQDAPPGLDASNPTGAVGHAYGVRTSSRLIRNYRELHRKRAMDITPQPVIDVLVKAGVKKWVLMGLHGYVGYLAEPRATQDVDIMVATSERAKAVKAIQAAWPALIVEKFSEVIRFKDPNDLGLDGRPRPTIDIMAPWAKFQQTILKDFVTVDKVTKHRIPCLEAALVAKYAAMISHYRSLEKKAYDAGDFRRIVLANHDRIDRKALRLLASQVWENGANEIEEFLVAVTNKKPFQL